MDIIDWYSLPSFLKSDFVVFSSCPGGYLYVGHARNQLRGELVYNHGAPAADRPYPSAKGMDKSELKAISNCFYPACLSVHGSPLFPHRAAKELQWLAHHIAITVSAGAGGTFVELPAAMLTALQRYQRNSCRIPCGIHPVCI